MTIAELAGRRAAAAIRDKDLVTFPYSPGSLRVRFDRDPDPTIADVPLGPGEEPADADEAPEPENDPVEEPA